MNRSIILTFVILSLLTGCGVAPSKNTSGKQTSYKVSTNDATAQKLYSHYQSWKGVQQKDGGMSRSGVDCSGFVRLTYKELLNESIPRTTALLSKKGSWVDIKALKVGDLVFFKTGIKQRHVGIYMGQNKFIHVSTKRGVMMSDLNNPYWKDAYWQSRRLL